MAAVCATFAAMYFSACGPVLLFNSLSVKAPGTVRAPEFIGSSFHS